ncbi:MAG: exonuclease domain-containing protein [Oscillospiraceae bacterium]|nr:exonuclease domain-containing protein [Oscillospiraceae bacterium]
MYEQHIIVDFEMNPVSQKYPELSKLLYQEIIEIGAVRLNSKGEAVDTFSCLVKPQYNTGVSKFVNRLTGIRSCDVMNALSFEEAVGRFNDWIGSKRTRIYSWSDSDLRQLKAECEIKSIEFPSNMRRWMDFQLLFPRLMKIETSRNQMSLENAATWYGIDFSDGKAHRAKYDAEVTAELLQPVLTGEYIAQRENINRNVHLKSDEHTGFRLGDIYADVFNQLFSQLQCEPELAR